VLTLDANPTRRWWNGRIQWIVDVYTTLETTPYAEQDALGDATQDKPCSWVLPRLPNIPSATCATCQGHGGTSYLSPPGAL